jgi:glycosyltransferase involved in cell wall biosynthesis
MSNNTILGLASIIVPCWNQLEFTRHCITALVRHTRRPWELIVVDNGSTDGTTIYLAGVHDAAAVPVTVISNRENRGFPAAINQGLAAARGEYLVMLNNDVVVTDAWLDQLTALTTAKTGEEENRSTAKDAKSAKEDGETNGKGEFVNETPNATIVHFADEVSASEAATATIAMTTPSPIIPGEPRTTDHGPRTNHPFTRGGKLGVGVGLVGPMSNYAAPPQRVENVPYHNLDEMHRFARTWRDEHRGRWFTVPKLSGFCLLMKRAVYEKIGGLDERFGLGFFDDDDLAERARRAGFELAVAHDLFIHHFGSWTFAGNGIDAEKLLDENAKRFTAKWGKTKPNGRRVALEPWSNWPAFFADSQRVFARRVDDGRAPRSRQAPNGSVPNPKRVALNSNGHSSAVPAIRTLRTSLTVIARDEEDGHPRCLESVAGLFDEIIVVDTRSTDRRTEIASSFGVKVYNFVWIDDFAAARNEALARATGDYAFWLDADDLIEPCQRETLKALLDGMRAGEDVACVVRCACDPAPDGTGGDTVVDHIRRRGAALVA